MKRRLTKAIEATRTEADKVEELLKQQAKERDLAIAEVARKEEEQKRIAEDELKMINDLSETISELCKEKGIWCGLSFTKQDVVNLISFAFNTSDEVITIPFKLYFDDKEDDKEDDINEDLYKIIGTTNVDREETVIEEGVDNTTDAIKASIS